MAWPRISATIMMMTSGGRCKELTKDTPYLALTVELWGVFCEFNCFLLSYCVQYRVILDRDISWVCSIGTLLGSWFHQFRLVSRKYELTRQHSTQSDGNMPPPSPQHLLPHVLHIMPRNPKYDQFQPKGDHNEENPQSTTKMPGHPKFYPFH